MPDTGFIIASAGVDDAGKGTVAWGNPGNVTADDGTDAVSSVSANESHWLRSSHDFSGILPINAVITGVTVRLQVFGVAAKVERVIELQLHNGLEFIGSAKTPNTTIPDSATNLGFGGAEDMWDATLNLIQIAFCDNPLQFAFRVDGDGFGASVSCDAMWIKIHYQQKDNHPGGGPRDLGGFGNDGPKVPGQQGDFI